MSDVTAPGFSDATSAPVDLDTNPAPVVEAPSSPATDPDYQAYLEKKAADEKAAADEEARKEALKVKDEDKVGFGHLTDDLKNWLEGIARHVGVALPEETTSE